VTLQQQEEVEQQQAARIAQQEELERKRLRAVAILKKVMNEGSLVESLDDLPDLNKRDGEGDDDSDDDSDDDDQSEEDDQNVSKKIRASNGYKPADNSPLGVYLMGVKDAILRDAILHDKITKSGLHWIPPPSDPVATASPVNPEPWYLADVWVYFWDPFLQHKLDISSCSCHHCGQHALESHEYDWRPFFILTRLSGSSIADWSARKTRRVDAGEHGLPLIQPLFQRMFQAPWLLHFPSLQQREGQGCTS
jgi:hypothetical protein